VDLNTPSATASADSPSNPTVAVVAAAESPAACTAAAEACAAQSAVGATAASPAAARSSVNSVPTSAAAELGAVAALPLFGGALKRTAQEVHLLCYRYLMSCPTLHMSQSICWSKLDLVTVLFAQVSQLWSRL